MFKNKRILCGVALLLVLTNLQAQKTSISPYSSFGYGDYRLSNDAANFGMGGVSSAYMSTYGSQANFANPAANINLNYTSFTFEGTSNASSFENGNLTAKKSTTYISKISLAFPMGAKWRGGFNFQPYSSLGYDITNANKETKPYSYNHFVGSGDINTLQVFTSYNVTNNFALGLKASYLFGQLNKEETFGTSSLPLVTAYDNSNKINGLNITGGLAYTKKLKNSKRLTLGANYTLTGGITSDQKYQILTYGLHPVTKQKYNESVVFEDNSTSDLKFPQKVGIGISYGEDFRWNIAAQLDWEQNSKFKLKNENVQFNDRFRTVLGGFIIPNINSYTNYFARITYRGGAFYERTPISVNGNDIQKYGITFGLGLPVGKASDPSEINIGLELGQQGTEKNNLIKETFANLKLSFTLNDSWFQRRKYN